MKTPTAGPIAVLLVTETPAEQAQREATELYAKTPTIPADCPLCEVGEALVVPWTLADVQVNVQACADCLTVEPDMPLLYLAMSWAVRHIRPDVCHRHVDGLVVFA